MRVTAFQEFKVKRRIGWRDHGAVCSQKVNKINQTKRKHKHFGRMHFVRSSRQLYTRQVTQTLSANIFDIDKGS